MTKNIAMIFGFVLMASNCFAGVENQVAQDTTVRKLVTTLAVQSYSGDPVYCSFAQAKKISSANTLNDVSYQVEIDCGVGISETQHSDDIKVFVKGYLEDSQVFVTGLQLNQQF